MNKRCKDCDLINTDACYYPYTIDCSIACEHFIDKNNKTCQQNEVNEDAKMRMPKTMQFYY